MKKSIAAIAAALLFGHAGLLAEVQLKKVPHNKPEVVKREADGSFKLSGPKAQIYGENGEGKIAIYDKEMCVGWFNSEKDYLIWEVEAPQDATVDLYLHFSISDEWAGNKFIIENGASKLEGTVPKTGGFEHFKTEKFGQIKLSKGLNKIKMKPAGKVNGEIADIKAVILKPAKP